MGSTGSTHGTTLKIIPAKNATSIASGTPCSLRLRLWPKSVMVVWPVVADVFEAGGVAGCAEGNVGLVVGIEAKMPSLIRMTGSACAAIDVVKENFGFSGGKQ